MYKIFNVFGEKFVLFCSSLILIQSNEQIDEAVKAAFENPECENIPAQLKKMVEIENETSRLLMEGAECNENMGSIQINTVNACNMRCKYCFADGGNHQKNNIMNEQQAKEVIDYIFAHTTRKEISIVIIGGEPLMNMPIFQYILEYGEKKSKEANVKVRFSTTTNGTLLNEEILNMLDEHHVTAMISQDSKDNEENDYLRVMENKNLSQFSILKEKKKLLLEKDKKRAIHITITPKNLDFCESAISFFEEGFYHVHLDFVKSDEEEFQFHPEDEEKILLQFNELTKHILKCVDNNKHIDCHPLTDRLVKIHNRVPRINKCSVMNGLYAIAPDCSIYPCDVLMYDEYKIGDIYDGFNMDKLNQMREQMIVPERCNKCWGRYICGGKCLAEVIKGVDSFSSNLFCKVARHTIKLQLYIYYYIMKNNPDYLKSLIDK